MSRLRRLGKRILLRDPKSRCVDQLRRAPVALYSDSLPLGVLWSAKAGCTFAVKWFFFQEGILDEALAYSQWVHRYRQKVFYERPGYLEGLEQIPTLGPRVVRFVRDPYQRIVSSYLQYCEQVQRPTPKSAPILNAIGDHLGRPVGEGSGFTFREFVSYLGAIDLDDADPHLRPQSSPCERAGLLPQLRIIKIEQSRQELPKLEAELGLKTSDYAELRRSPHHTSRADLPGFFGDTPFGHTRDVATPRTPSFYDQALVREVGRLYAEDCETYGYAFDLEIPTGSPGA